MGDGAIEKSVHGGSAARRRELLFFLFFGDVGGWARTRAVRGASWALLSHGIEGAGAYLYASGDGVYLAAL